MTSTEQTCTSSRRTPMAATLAAVLLSLPVAVALSSSAYADSGPAGKGNPGRAGEAAVQGPHASGAAKRAAAAHRSAAGPVTAITMSALAARTAVPVTGGLPGLG